MPKLDTQLLEMVQRWFAADNMTDKLLIQGEAERYMIKTGRAHSARTAYNYWKLLTDLLEKSYDQRLFVRHEGPSDLECHEAQGLYP